jgi:aryl-alcohol dehydrogenase-like predicted oxidoreductase
MRYTTLGRTGLTVSVAGLGCGGFSRLGLGSGQSTEHAAGLVRQALDLGVNLIDTAAAYGTEDVVGTALRQVPRDSVVVCTKASKPSGDATFSADKMVASLDASLKRLGLDYVDVFQLHAVPPAAYDHVRDVVAPALLRQRDKGKFRFLGISETAPNDPEQKMLNPASRDDCCDTAMIAFHLMHQVARTQVFPHTIANRIGTLMMFVVSPHTLQIKHSFSGEAVYVRARPWVASCTSSRNAYRRPASRRSPDPAHSDEFTCLATRFARRAEVGSIRFEGVRAFMTASSDFATLCAGRW